ncbi:hypothetical protein [Tropicimonas sp. IMCC6043]|uniref:hypothetical protein n=1 Tax=Tropicimonas sp. IMCC6043 TaxID=2510645 RepID=UPI00101C226C|nr:hypothetical protein [Tropicimonas sp. IMCC6043]RYH08541.1 hypothetical protein EU800_15975 [Tropicimonas sp. IMCC6043]
MAPLLNLTGLSMLNPPEAVVETELLEPDGSNTRYLLRGRAEIEGYFERLSERLASTQHVERDRGIRARRALWSGTFRAIRVSNGAPITLNASYRLEFDEAGLVMHQSTRLAPSRSR